jgi:hypothetical protein
VRWVSAQHCHVWRHFLVLFTDCLDVGFCRRDRRVPCGLAAALRVQGQHPMVLVLSRGGFCPKDRRRPKGFLNSTVRWRLAIAGLSRSVLTTSPRRTNIAAASALTGPSSQTRGVSSKKLSTSRRLGELDLVDPVGTLGVFIDKFGLAGATPCWRRSYSACLRCGSSMDGRRRPVAGLLRFTQAFVAHSLHSATGPQPSS